MNVAKFEAMGILKSVYGASVANVSRGTEYNAKEDKETFNRALEEQKIFRQIEKILSISAYTPRG